MPTQNSLIPLYIVYIYRKAINHISKRH